GARPLLPDRLAYPEILDKANLPDNQQYFYDGTVDDLTRRLSELIEKYNSNDENTAQHLIGRYFWPTRAKELDDAFAGMSSFDN
ncbi:MAG: hypothetical protein JW709_12900, partial [Sedimentisphaerales bacterium]|nr:hypothetical protein [Sedimentisphaerales bacterium]